MPKPSAVGIPLVREFREETGLEVRVGRFLHLHEFSHGDLQALELFFEVTAVDAQALAQLGHDPEHVPSQQILTHLEWLSPRQLTTHGSKGAAALA